jgi:hypothetical protein
MFKYIFIITFLILIQNIFSQFQLEPPEPIEPASNCDNYTAPALLFRFGLTKHVELMISFQYSATHTELTEDKSVSTESGIPPVKAGIKCSLIKGKSLIPSVSMIVNFSIPYFASKNLRTDFIAPEIVFSASHDFDKITIGYNAGLLWDGCSAEPSESYIISLNYTPFSFGAVFAEAYGCIKKSGEADNRLDCGVSFFPLRNLQVDFAGGIGLSGVSPNKFIGFGLAYCLPKL